MLYLFVGGRKRVTHFFLFTILHKCYIMLPSRYTRAIFSILIRTAHCFHHITMIVNIKKYV